jgi:hypothetical protein
MSDKHFATLRDNQHAPSTPCAANLRPRALSCRPAATRPPSTPLFLPPWTPSSRTFPDFLTSSRRTLPAVKTHYL